MRTGCSGPCSVHVRISLWMVNSKSLSSIAMLIQCHDEKSFPDVKAEFPVFRIVLIVSCSSTDNKPNRSQVWFYPLCILPQGRLQRGPPFPFFSQSWTNAVPYAFPSTSHAPSLTTVRAFHWTHCCTSGSVVCTGLGAKKQTLHSLCSLTSAENCSHELPWNVNLACSFHFFVS